MKDIIGFPGYVITKDGIVFSKKTKQQIRISSCDSRNGVKKLGYPYVRIYNSKFNKKPVKKYLHKILAELFIPNPEKKPQVNHIDGNVKNYNLYNLEWCTQSENMQHAIRTGLRKKSYITKNNVHKKPIVQMNLNRQKLAIWQSAKQCQHVTGIHQSNISSVCLGKRKSTAGYIFNFISL